MKRLFIAVAFVAFLSLLAPQSQPARAVELSSACAAINGSVADDMGGSLAIFYPGSYSFFAGETLRVIGEPATEPYYTTIVLNARRRNRITYNGSAGTTSQVSYTFPTDFTSDGIEFGWTITSGTGTNVRAVLYCFPPSAPGPSAPVNFVQRRILCDSSIYNTPNGAPVGDNKVTAGQAWYVAPATVTGFPGWREIFVASYTNGFVKSACVAP